MLIVDVERATVLLDLAEISIAKVLVRPNRLNGIVFAHARKQSKDKALSFAELASARTDFNAARNTEQIEVKRARHIVTDFRDRTDNPNVLASGDILEAEAEVAAPNEKSHVADQRKQHGY